MSIAPLPARLLPLALLLALGACNTIEGAGRDMQQAGSAISQEARQAEAGM
ncbi:entericidin A/B family lipoprotein [Pseudogemmobacter humi]|uniref:Entericidin B membrane lipoprotein n=1 Tax=Pseudogemmobacter humi TaxID=2483812 RepID=A0A3P5XIW9_9RHOB|nr:entericidin A/B family lipoprotein [Pseudogemmobacter humi]VDC31526.1 entericidin B membrane lipoprotein [Pseudogemmobacter humi]